MKNPNLYSHVVTVVALITVLGFPQLGFGQAALVKNFYQNSCPNAEKIVRQIIWSIVEKNPKIAPRLLRMHFHDCFVRGCDASILIDSTQNNAAEKDSGANSNILGFEVIDSVKTALEKACPGIVSCADILALSARDAVSFQFRTSIWEVLTGRRDGRVSSAPEADTNLPGPSSNFPALLQSFQSKKLSLRDVVVLSGAHTIGISHCNFFSNRVFNFNGINAAIDPLLNPSYAQTLRRRCNGLTDSTSVVPMDFGKGSSFKFDNHYYTMLKEGRGLFQSDAALLTNPQAAKIVDELLNPTKFLSEFALSMLKLAAIEVKTGNQGEVRRRCNAVN